MGITDLIIKISSSKFARRFQYEPYIIKTLEYINPLEKDRILVIYKEVDYLSSPVNNIYHPAVYKGIEVEGEMELKETFDKVILFFSIHDLPIDKINTLKKHLNDDSRLFVIFYSDSGWFFKTVLKITDREAFENLNRPYENLLSCGFRLEDELTLNRYHIRVSRYRKEG